MKARRRTLAVVTIIVIVIAVAVVGYLALNGGGGGEEKGITGEIIVFWAREQLIPTYPYQLARYNYYVNPGIEDDHGNRWLLSSSDMITTFQYYEGLCYGTNTTIKGYQFFSPFGEHELAGNGWDGDWWICRTGKRVRVTGTITENTSGYGYEKMNRISVETIEELD